MTVAYPCPTSLPTTTTISPIPATTVNDQTAASTYVTVTQTPTNFDIDRTPPIWLIVTIIVVAVVVIMTCTCVCLVLTTVMLKKQVQQGTHAKKGNLRNIVVQDELHSQSSVKSYESSVSVKSKVGQYTSSCHSVILILLCRAPKRVKEMMCSTMLDTMSQQLYVS